MRNLTWKKAKAILDGEGKRRGPRDSVKIARNTWLERGPAFKVKTYRRDRAIVMSNGYASAGDADDYPDNAIGLRLHNTYVVIMTPYWSELYTGGWHTMTTADRMRYVVDVGGYTKKHRGWAVYTTGIVPCYCATESDSYPYTENDKPADVGYVLKFTERYTEGKVYQGEIFDPEVHRHPIYRWVKCPTCEGTGERLGVDFDSGGHPYYDGIRISSDGRRVLKTQPHRPRSIYREPVVTESGW